MLTVGLIGNPNCGKTTLFNHLTDRCESTGNWSGVTVKDVSGCHKKFKDEFCFVDCPGIYSLTQVSSSALDKSHTFSQLFSGRFDLIVNVIDATALERNLYLTSQLIEAGFKVVVVLNMMDIVRKKGIRINIKELSIKLGCPVISLVAHNGMGVSVLLSAIKKHEDILKM